MLLPTGVLQRRSDFVWSSCSNTTDRQSSALMGMSRRKLRLEFCVWSCDWTLYCRVQSQLRRPCAHTINRSKAGVDETLGDRVGKVFLEEEARVAVHDRLCVGDEDALKMPGGRGLGERRDFSIGTLYARLSSCSWSCAAGVEPGHGRRCLSRIWTASLSSASGRRRGDQAHHAAHNERADAHALSEASNLELVGSVPFVPHASLGCLG
jgi:hypothetical protein